MKLSLFIDSSDCLTLGLLNEKFEWLEFKKFSNRKSSGVFHGLVEELLKNHSVTLFDLDRVFYSVGPGSYTGIRLVEGFCQILRWQGITTNSFYLFEAPFLTGVNKGVWISEAYKGESFVYKWDGDFNEKKLIKKEDLNSTVKEEDFLISQESFENLETKSITDFIKENSKDIFSSVLKLKLERGPYYYRAIENEFSKPKKVRRHD